MSTFKAFERAKVARFINTYGNSFTFRRRSLNEYNEPQNECECIATIKGVYHDANGGYKKEAIGDDGRKLSSFQPMILCLQDSNSSQIKSDDIVRVGCNWYQVVRLVSVGNYEYAYEIVLELIDNGDSL